MTLACSLAVLVLASTAFAQAPTPAATGPTEKPAEGFTPGWTLGTRFEGSYSGDGGVYDLGSALGYNFSRHFGVDAGIPYYFVSTPTAIKKKNTTAASGEGVGSAFVDLRLNYPSQRLNYSSAIHLTAPTGDIKKGFSTGHATWNLANHFDHAWGYFTPYVDASVGNTVTDTKYFHRPFVTFGYNFQSEGGLEFDAGQLSVSGSAYDVAPWGPQTVISKVFRCTANGKCHAQGTTKDRRGFTQTSVLAGAADLVRDNGFNGGIEYKPMPFLDLEFDVSRSVPLQLTSYSFGVSMDLSWALRPHVQAH